MAQYQQQQSTVNDFFKDVLAAREQVELVEDITTPESIPSSPELASDSGSSSVASLDSPISPPVNDQPVADDFVYAFDIDGVLVRGGKAIPEAIEAMKVLDGQNKYGIKVYVTIPVHDAHLPDPPPDCGPQKNNPPDEHRDLLFCGSHGSLTLTHLQTSHFPHQRWWQDRRGAMSRPLGSARA